MNIIKGGDFFPSVADWLEVAYCKKVVGLNFSNIKPVKFLILSPTIPDYVKVF